MPHKYKPYPQYETTHLGWLKHLPSHWSVKRLKYLGNVLIGLTYSPDDVVDMGEGVLVLRSSNIQNKLLSFDDNVYVNKPIPEKLVTRKNDILICARNGSRALIGKNALIDEQATGVTFGAFMSIFRSPYNNYLSKVFNSTLFEYQSGSFLTSTINQLTTGNLNSFEIPLPPVSEQRAIATFLDHETGKIDELIEKQQKLIELLEEKRQAVISHAVTKGLNPNAPMKDSGIEWLGNIPEHWNIKKFTYLFRLKSGDFINANDIEATGSYPVYGGNGLRGYTVNNNLSGKYILIGRQGALCGNIKVVNGDFWVTEHALVVYPIQSYNLEWMSQTLHAMNLNQYSTAAAQPGLSVEQLSILRLPYPPKDEQKAIAYYLDEQTAKIDKLISQAKSAIELMRERRTALISAAVTGKIDVRDFKMVTEQKTIKANIHFKRSVLAAEIAKRMQHQNKFGRIKFQKILVLCDLHLDMDIGGNYQRDAAGPFDNRMMRSITSQLAKQKWFKPVKPKDGYGTKYVPMEKAGGHQEYFYKYWGDKLDRFNELLALLGPMTTEQAEIVATLYSAWHDFLEQGEQPTDEELVTEVRTNWHESKKRIEPARWHKAINWMRQKALVPHGAEC